MNRVKYIKYYILFFILGGIFSLFLWDYFLSSDEVIEVRYDSTIYQIDSIDVPVPYETVKYVHTARTDTLILTDTLYLYDTIRIVQDFKFKRLYSDTIKDDQLVAYLDETVQFNRIINREFSYQILRPTEIINKPVGSIYLGAYLYNTGVVPYAQYNRNKWSVSAGFDPMNTRVFIGGGFKIR